MSCGGQPSLIWTIVREVEPCPPGKNRACPPTRKEPSLAGESGPVEGGSKQKFGGREETNPDHTTRPGPPRTAAGLWSEKQMEKSILGRRGRRAVSFQRSAVNSTAVAEHLLGARLCSRTRQNTTQPGP